MNDIVSMRKMRPLPRGGMRGAGHGGLLLRRRFLFRRQRAKFNSWEFYATETNRKRVREDHRDDSPTRQSRMIWSFRLLNR